MTKNMKKGNKTKSPWPLWMGIHGFRFVHHGDWADPEIIWHGHAMNIHAVEDPMWEIYAERCRETGAEATEERFVRFCRSERHLLSEYARQTINSGCATRVQGTRLTYSPFSHGTPCIRVQPAM